jgi:hypothetical protein
MSKSENNAVVLGFFAAIGVVVLGAVVMRYQGNSGDLLGRKEEKYKLDTVRRAR